LMSDAGRRACAVGEDAEHLARDVAEHRFAERPSCDRVESGSPSMNSAASRGQPGHPRLGKAGDEPGNARVCKVSARRSFALEGVDLRRPGTTANWSSLRRDLAIGRVRAVHAPVGTWQARAPRGTRGIAGHTAERHSGVRHCDGCTGTAVSKFPRIVDDRDPNWILPDQREANTGYRASGDTLVHPNHPGFPWRRGRRRKDCR